MSSGANDKDVRYELVLSSQECPVGNKAWTCVKDVLKTRTGVRFQITTFSGMLVVGPGCSNATGIKYHCRC